jgi:putative phosphoesterase
LITVGVISDTHGLLRPSALDALQGSDYIIHAGDVGDSAILDRLRTLAPVTVVRGNVDSGSWAKKLPITDILDVGGVSIYVLHILQDLDLKPEVAGFAAVVYGHSHKPEQAIRNGVLYFNPGSAGPKRFSLPISVAKLSVAGGRLTGELITLTG